MDNENIKLLLRSAAVKYNLIKSNVVKDNDGNKFCAGSGFCDGITKDNYNILKRKYGITKEVDELFSKNERVNDYYIFQSWGGTLTIPAIVNDSISFEIIDNIIFLTYKIDVDYILDNKNNFNKTLKYTFKQYDDGTYYLYSVYVKDNK